MRRHLIILLILISTTLIGQTVYVTDTGSKYHRNGCRYLNKSKNAIELSNAIQAYDPCSVCSPPTKVKQNVKVKDNPKTTTTKQNNSTEKQNTNSIQKKQESEGDYYSRRIEYILDSASKVDNKHPYNVNGKSASNTNTVPVKDMSTDTALLNALARQKKQYEERMKKNGQTSSPIRLDLSNDVIYTESEDEIFTVVEEMPEFPGGSMNMKKYIQSNLVYPPSATKERISGKSFVKFVVNKDGTIGSVQIIKGLSGCKECDDEAVRVVKSMPKWTPGKQSGKPVSVYYNIPITFIPK
ncbi:MAG: energy transducer TonB [Bacteroidia bacterium]|nr:energy transducer TonB [Bacteroidia bacterium]